MKRRNMLKSVGVGTIGTTALANTARAASRSWQYGYSEGDTDSFDSVNVEIYKASPADESYRRDARRAAETVFGQAYDADRIAGYEVTTYNTDYEVADCSDIWNEWHDFRTQQTDWHEHGIHFLVTACDSDALGKGAPKVCWSNDGSGYARTSANSRDSLPFKHTCGMEYLHSFIDKSCDQVQNLTGPDNDEHSLGSVIDVDGEKLETPIAKQAKWDDGFCDYDGSSKDGLTMQVTYCSKRSLELSAEHDDGQH